MLTLCTDERTYGFLVLSACAEANAVPELQDVRSVNHWVNSCDSVGIHEITTMYPEESVRCQPSFQVAECLAQQE